MAQLTYNPDVFAVSDQDAAKRIILTPQAGQNTDERWRRETPYLQNLILQHLGVAAGDLVVDFGCGIGRMAKALIEAARVNVLGVDISPQMRGLAPEHVSSNHFSVVSPEVFRVMVARGLRAQGAISVWVIQHCLDPRSDIAALADCLEAGKRLVVVNNVGRAVPTKEKPWASDGLDVKSLLRERFDVVREDRMDADVVGESVAEWTFWGSYAKP